MAKSKLPSHRELHKQSVTPTAKVIRDSMIEVAKELRQEFEQGYRSDTCSLETLTTAFYRIADRIDDKHRKTRKK